ncbi:MAG TPA: RDD family protein [Candidatus Nanoarchaeia archaeon]|nr:RDD family protein [Candidatus Nanoarchaeia archaeon]
MEPNQTPQTNPAPPAPTAAPVSAPVAAAASDVKYAGFWIRFVAAVIDSIAVGVVTTPLQRLFSTGSTGPINSATTAYSGTDLMLVILSWAITLTYYALLTSSSWQATLGKKALGLKVTDVAGNRLTPGKAFLREGAKIISAAVLLIGYIMAAFDSRKQALHDKIAGTLVVRG